MLESAPGVQTPAWPEGTEHLRTKAVLRYFLDRLGSGEAYSVDVSTEDLTNELYEQFGVYDSVAVASAYDKLQRYPSLLKNKTLRDIAAVTKKNDGFDHSFVWSATRSVEPALLPLKERAAELEAIPDLHIKAVMLQALRQQMETFITLRKFETYSAGRRARLTLQDLEYDPSAMVYSPQGSSVDLRDIGQALRRAEFTIQFEERIGYLDRERLQAETLVYGAKGANLDVLKPLEQVFCHFGLGLEFHIPDYEKVPASVHEGWKSGAKISGEALRVHHWMSGRKSILRSSAVYSEDSETATGAGIYDSIVLEERATPRDVFLAMKKIYQSVDNPEAVQYRAEHGITQESMGLVIQEYIEASEGNRGTINTVVKNVPELMEIVYADGLRPMIVKERALEEIGGADSSGIFHYELDLRRKNTFRVVGIALLSTLIEKHYGQPLQLEFVERENSEYRFNETHLVQARFLPQSFSEKKTIEFPDETPLFEGRAVGAFDITLPILPNLSDNREKTGVVILDSTKLFSIASEHRIHPIPKNGGVITLQAAREGGGHVETICAEKGIALIFSDNAPEITNSNNEIMKVRLGIKEGVFVKNTHLGGYTTLRLVSDGLVGKVYGVGEPSQKAHSKWIESEDGGYGYRDGGL